MKNLIISYQGSLRLVRHLKETANDEDKILLSSMESDLRYALEWMKTARRPGNRRGIERLAAYQREKPMDPLLMQKYFSSTTTMHSQLDQTDLDRIEDALSVLTKLEKEIYLMARGQALPRSEIAIILGIEKGTVNKILTRADNKIKDRTENSLFCLPIATYM